MGPKESNQTNTKCNAREMFRIINDTPITYMDWLTWTNSESVISHIDSVLKDIQQASEEEDMDYEISFQT